MNGVTIPGVSAGSNHVGASETWTPQVTWPSGAAAAGPAAAPEIARTRAVTERRGLIVSLQQAGSMGNRTTSTSSVHRGRMPPTSCRIPEEVHHGRAHLESVPDRA